LKHYDRDASFAGLSVAPFTGAWIETSCRHCGRDRRLGRPLHGGVD